MWNIHSSEDLISFCFVTSGVLGGLRLDSKKEIIREFERHLGKNSYWFINNIALNYKKEYESIPYDDPGDGRFFIRNGYFEEVDSEVLYSIIRWLKPKRIIEIGAGYSTMVAREAVSLNGTESRIISIDPDPRRDIEKLSDKTIRVQFEFVSPKLFRFLEPNDILFVDSSHCGEDVDFVLFEILDGLRNGVYVHFHDIFFPRDYPEACLKAGYSEQYKLIDFLSDRFQQWDPIFGGNLSQLKFKDLLCRVFPSHRNRPDRPPGSFWIKKSFRATSSSGA